VSTALRHQLQDCDGFRVESPDGVLGWIEETWLGPTHEPAALAIKTADGRRGLLLADDIETVVAGNELVLARSDGRVLELDVPRVEAAATAPLSASWRTTGEVLALDPGSGRSGARGTERPLWEVVAILYAALALIVCLVMALAFLASYLASGWVY
jgi:hypothetical protein